MAQAREAIRIPIRPAGPHMGYAFLERLTRKPRFYLLLTLLPAAVPPYAQRVEDYWAEWGEAIWVVSEAFYQKRLLFDPYMPLMHLAVALLLVALFMGGQRMARPFALLVGLHFLFTLYIQTTVVTETYGLVVVSMLSLWYAIVAALWFWEALIGRSRLTFRRPAVGQFWLIAMAFMAFWDPDQPWQLDPAMILFSSSPAAFCMITPIYLSVLLLSDRPLNLPLLRVNGYLGLVVGVLTLGVAFTKDLSSGLYWVLLHVPMLVVSGYAFGTGLRTVEWANAGLDGEETPEGRLPPPTLGTR